MATGSSTSAAATDEAKTSKSSGPDPLIGRLVNERFKITGLIARGGMGKVYKAEQAPLGRVCAVKVLNPNYSGEHDPEFHKRFFLEASISAKLTHPNTVTIFDYGRTDDNVYYMAMEFLEGRTLHRALRDVGPFTEDRATHIARQICRSLREAHSLGVIHRDLKPANVYLIEHGDETDFVKVLDFGLVKNIEEGKGEDLTQTGLFMGSPKYMAPEQIRGEHVDARTDIYALGVILYEMITGKVPFDRPNSVNILMAHVNEPVPPLRDMNPNVDVSEALEAVIFKCVAKSPDDRFKSMDDVLAALKKAGSGAMTGTMSGVDRSGAFDLLSTTGSFTPQPTPSSLSGALTPLSPDPGSGAFNTTGAGALATGNELRPKSKTPLVIGALLVLGVVIGIVVMASSKGDGPSTASSGSTAASAPTTGASTTTKASATETAPASTTAPTVAAVEKVKVDSDPSGAMVKDESGTILCDKTPCDIVVDDKPKKLTIDLKEYKNETIAVKKGDPSRQVKLTKAAVWIPPKKDDPKKDPGGGNPNKDFKGDPY